MSSSIEDIIQNAGNMLARGFCEVQRFGEKESGHLLSEYDVTVNNYLTQELLQRFPQDTVISEEAPGNAEGDGDTWIVDPIDGSAYFIFGEPYFSISIARERSGEIVEGHVYNPITRDYFYSDAAGKTSALNNKEITVSKVDKLEDSLLAFGFSANMKAIHRYYEDWQQSFERCKKGIAWICPALSICNVARGRLEAFIDFGCSREGQAAASLILRNAGGALFNYGDAGYDHRVKGGIFTNGLFDIGTAGNRPAAASRKHDGI